MRLRLWRSIDTPTQPQLAEISCFPYEKQVHDVVAALTRIKADVRQIPSSRRVPGSAHLAWRSDDNKVTTLATTTAHPSLTMPRGRRMPLSALWMPISAPFPPIATTAICQFRATYFVSCLDSSSQGAPRCTRRRARRSRYLRRPASPHPRSFGRILMETS